VSKASLLAGYSTALAPDATKIVRVRSTSALCSNYLNIPLELTTTTTTTIAPTTTTTTTL